MSAAPGGFGRPWLAERVVCDDADFLVVDKPAGIVVHGGDEELGGDVVSRLTALLRERGDDAYLGVHQRLDLETSGVLAFVRRRDLNAEVSRAWDAERVEKTYVAAVSDPGLPREGQWVHRIETRDGSSRVVDRGGKLARSNFRVLERGDGRALLELSPQTGRTHQLRVQLAAANAPIAGDRRYGGALAERLLLHASELALPSLGRRFAAPAPARLREWVRGEPARLPNAELLPRTLADAVCLRWPLARCTTAHRIANDVADALPGVVIDRYAAWIVLSVSEQPAIERRVEIAERLLDLGATGVYVKLRPRADLRKADTAVLAPPEPLAGEPAPSPLVVEEHGIRLRVLLGDGFSTGLFVDQRDNRQRVRRSAHGLRVLNLFAYTGSFSVAAALGGARDVTSVDLSARALERCRENFRENGLDPALHRFVKEDVVAWLARARRRNERYSLVIVDPPSFGTSSKRTFSMPQGYRDVARDAFALLEKGGRLLAVTNHKKTPLARFRRLLREAAEAAGRQVRQMKDLPSALDCPPLPDGPSPSKSVLVTLE